MAEKVDVADRLVAIDGSRGRDVSHSAEALAAEVRERGAACLISRWDASGLFEELAQADEQQRHISARTLALVFAADLAFRLRWEIRPALEAGHVVIAAPYVDTAVTFAMASGLTERWVRDVLRFAPQARTRCVARERKADRGWKPRLDRGYPEYCAAMLGDTDPSFKARRARAAMIDFLHKLKGRKSGDFSTGDLRAAARAIAATGNPPASSTPAAWRPRTEQT